MNINETLNKYINEANSGMFTPQEKKALQKLGKKLKVHKVTFAPYSEDKNFVGEIAKFQRDKKSDYAYYVVKASESYLDENGVIEYIAGYQSKYEDQNDYFDPKLDMKRIENLFHNYDVAIRSLDDDEDYSDEYR